MAVQNKTSLLVSNGGVNSVLSIGDTGLLTINDFIVLGSKSKLPILVKVVDVINQKEFIIYDINNNPIDASSFTVSDKAFISFSYLTLITPPPNFVPTYSGSTETIDVPCGNSVNVGQFVYIDNTDVARVADCSSIATAPALGIIINKASPQLATIQISGKNNFFNGLSPGMTYYLSNSGNITSTVTNIPQGIVQKIGTALLTNILFINIDSSITIL